MADVLPDEDLTRIVVSRRMQYAHTHYTSWTAGLARVALGVIPTSTSNSIKMQDMGHFYIYRMVAIISVRTEGRRTCSKKERSACLTA